MVGDPLIRARLQRDLDRDIAAAAEPSSKVPPSTSQELEHDEQPTVVVAA